MHFDFDGQWTPSAPRNIRLAVVPHFLVLGRTGEMGKKARVSGWHNAPVASGTLAEVILVSYLIPVANFKSEVGMVAWIDSVIGCTAGCMAGMYLGEAGQKPSQGLKAPAA